MDVTLTNLWQLLPAQHLHKIKPVNYSMDEERLRRPNLTEALLAVDSGWEMDSHFSEGIAYELPMVEWWMESQIKAKKESNFLD